MWEKVSPLELIFVVEKVEDHSTKSYLFTEVAVYPVADVHGLNTLICKNFLFYSKGGRLDAAPLLPK